MNLNKKLKVIGIVILAIAIAVISCMTVQERIRKTDITIEDIKALEYGELEEDDYTTQSENVEFSVFFAKDLDRDGYAERVKGATASIGSSYTELFAELKVNSGGYLKNGYIAFNAQNFNWSTSIVADSVVKRDYIGTVNYIQLNDEVLSGSQKLFSGTISSKLGNNINDYSKVNSVTLRGTYVDNDGNETPIEVTRQVTVDWYGSVSTSIDTNYQTQNVVYDSESMTVSVQVFTSELNGQLKLKENTVTVEGPEINGYKPRNAYAMGGNYEFDADTGIVTIQKSSTVDNNGNVINSLIYTNKYTVEFDYPIEARGYNELGEPQNYTSIEIPVSSTYIGYNNQTEGFTKEVSSTAHGIIALIEPKESHGNIISANEVAIGEYSSKTYRYIISKEKATQAYNDIETENDNYKVMWGTIHEGGTTNIVLKETKPDQILANGGSTYTLSNIVKYTGIYFVGSNAKNIKVYNDETNELIAEFEDASGVTQYNPYIYPEKVNKVRVEIGRTTSIDEFKVYNIKQIDDEAMVNTYSKSQFNTFAGIYTYLTISGDEISNTENKGYAIYSDFESQVTMSIGKKNVRTQDLSTAQTIIIEPTASDLNQIGWKNGSFLVEFPSKIIYSEIESISISDPSVEILGYDLYKENNSYFLKILTANSNRTTYRITVNCNITMNPVATSGSGKYVLYAYNEDCNSYYGSTTDIYDVNNNNNFTEKVGTYSTYMTITAPSDLITSQSVTNYDDKGSITIAPNIAEVDKSDRTADININVLNNYERTVSEIQILGTIPFENNTYIENEDELGSEFTAPMLSNGIQVPNGYNGKVIVYYSENPTATKDLEDESNGWTKTPEDFSRVRRYLIDFGNNSLASGSSLVFKYKVQIPSSAQYNQFTFTDHKIYFAIETSGGKLTTKISPNKLGIRIVRKYGLNLLKINAETNKPVSGAVYTLKELNDEGEVVSNRLASTNNEGRLIVNGLYVNRKYILEETKNPSNYSLNEEDIEFIVREKENKELEIEVLSENGFKTTPTIEDNTLTAIITDEPRYKVTITKKDEATDEVLRNVKFTLLPQEEQYTTNRAGIITLTNLDQKQEYTLKETYAQGYYLLDDITFKLEKNQNGEFKVISNNEDFENATVTVKEEEDLIEVGIELGNERQPSLIINKIDSVTRNPIKDVEFEVKDRIAQIYKTDEEGKVTINGFAENEEYTINELKAEGYYLQNIKFKIVRDEQDKLKVESDNADFANATVVDEDKKILSIVLPNEKIPTYDLVITKTEEATPTKTLEGAKFQLTEVDTDKITEYTTDENGKINLSGLYAYVEGKNISGNYILKELEAPKGYSNNAEEIKFKVVKNTEEDTLEVIITNQDELETVANATIINGALNLVLEDKALFTLIKTDKDTGAPLANVDFIIQEIKVPVDFARDLNGDYVGTLNEKGQYIVTTDENGRIALPLRDGKYAIIEVSYPEGYEEQEAIEYFVVGEEQEAEEEPDEPDEPVEPEEYIENVEYIEDLLELALQLSEGVSYDGRTVTLSRTLDFNDDDSYRDPNSTKTDLRWYQAKFFGMGFDGEQTIKNKCTLGGGFRFKSFSGIFDGNGYEIRNINIRFLGSYNDDTTYAGLFTNIKNAQILNLGVTGTISKAGTYDPNCLGGIVAYAYNSTIANCYTSVNISDSTASNTNMSNIGGGIAGYASSTKIINCYSRGSITTKGYFDAAAGGIVGDAENGTEIINCYSTGNMIASGQYRSDSYSGPIVGKNNGIVKNSYYLNSATISGANKNTAGTATTATNMQKDEFIATLNDQAFGKDEENVNGGFPILVKKATAKEMIEKVEYIEDLVELAEQVDYTETYEGIELILENNLDFNEDSSYRNPEDESYGDINGDGTVEGIKEELSKGTGFKPIGAHGIFQGTFNGNNKEIKNLYVNNSETKSGLFGEINNAIVKDLKVSGDITTTCITTQTVGMVGKSTDSDISNCETALNIDASSDNTINAGGIVGASSGTSISDCISKDKITISEPSRATIGGIIGQGASGTNTGNTIDNCTSMANIKITNSDYLQYVGGIAGTATTIKNCNSSATIETTGKITYIGGIVGYSEYNNTDISNCVNHTDIPNGEYVGGIAGRAHNGNIVECTNQASLNGEYVGGIVGQTLYHIILDEIYNEGDLTGTKVGGIVGSSANDQISNAHNKGKIQGTTAGGIIGDANVANLTNSHNEGELSGKTVGGVVGSMSKGNILRCYNTKDINIEEDAYAIGGIVGSAIGTTALTSTIANTTIATSYNKGNITVNGGDSMYVGGIVGISTANVKSCYNRGNITAKSTSTSEEALINAAGIVGGVFGASTATTKDCYNTGKVITDLSSSTSTESYVGGILGYAQSGRVQNCYYLENIQLSGNTTSDKGTAVSDTHMKTDEFIEELNKTTFTKDTENTNNGYPILTNSSLVDKLSINYIEDLVDMSQEATNGNNFLGEEITLERTLDFTDDESYKDPTDESYGDLNGDGTIEGIKEELSKGKGFTSIGNYGTPFKGTFKGNNKEIKNIYINKSTAYGGLFTFVDEGVVKDLSISGYIESSNAAGGIVGLSRNGTYINCHNYANVKGYQAGGIVGEVYKGTTSGSEIEIVIENCHNEGKIESTSNYLGGIVGSINGASKVTIKDSYNKGTLYSDYSSGKYVGGILGGSYNSNDGIIDNCYNDGTIELTTSGNYNYVGGIVGYISNDAFKITNSYNNADLEIIPGLSGLGGILGYSSQANVTIEKCYNNGNIFHECLPSSDYPYIGGIAGYMSSGSVDNCYNIGDIITEKNVYGNLGQGGIVGSSGGIIVSNCYNTGKISAEDNTSGVMLGGIIGYEQSGAYVKNCYNEGIIYAEDSSSKNNSNTDYVGGIKGLSLSSNSLIENSYNKANIIVKATYQAYVGGLQGNSGTVLKSFNTGNINVYQSNSNSAPYVEVGGISANQGTCIDVYNTGDIYVEGQFFIYAGGIGSYGGETQNAYNTGNITVKIVNPNQQYPCIYTGGIVGGSSGGTVTNCYNTGNITTIDDDTNNSNTGMSTIRNYTGGIVTNGSVTNCYNTGDITQKTYGRNQAIVEIYAGGIVANGNAQNSYNSGNLNIEGTKTARYSQNDYLYVGSITGNGTATNNTNLGNVSFTSENIDNIQIGKIAGEETQNNPTNYYLSSMKLDVDTQDEYTVITHGTETQLDEINTMPDITSVEYFNEINGNGVWAHLSEYPPKLLISQAKSSDAAKVSITNKIKKFQITTDVDESDGLKGGTITGEDELPFETLTYGEDNTKEIIITPSEGCAIESIKINGEKIAFKVNEIGQYKMPAGYFENVKEDKEIIVKFSVKEQVLTINKVDSDDNSKPLQGAKFNVNSAVDINTIFGKLTNNGTYYFEEMNGKLVPNNIGVSERANSYIPIDLRNLSGDYYVVINADSSTTICAAIGEDSTPITNSSYYTDDNFMYINGGVSGAQNYASNVIRGGKLYYLKLSSESISSGTTYNNQINNIRLFKKNEDKSEVLGEVTANDETRSFKKKANGKIVLTDGTDGTESAYAYVEIDLTDKIGTYNVLMKTDITMMSSSLFFASITDNTEKVTNGSPYNKFAYVNSTNGNSTYVSEPLEGGNKYYLQLSYMGGHPLNEITIESLIVAKSGVAEIFLNNNGEENAIIDENEVFGKLTANPAYDYDKEFILYDGKYTNEVANPATGYIEVDLRGKEGNYNVLLDAQIENGGQLLASITKNKDSITSYHPYARMLNISGTADMQTYSSPILEGGNKYYLQLRYSGGGYIKNAKISNIRLVKSSVVESFNNAGSGILGQVTNNGDNYFEYVDGKLIPNYDSEENTNGNSYIKVDLTNKEGLYAIAIQVESSSMQIVAKISDNTDPETNTSYYTNESFAYVDGGALGFGVGKDYTFVSTPLSGGKEYYLKLVGATSKAGDVSINSINVIKLENVEQFKNNKGEVFSLTDLVTDENGQIKVTLPYAGKYAITETEAPKGYTLLNTPIITKVSDVTDNEVTIENTAKQKLVVHHYLKQSDGTETEIQVADDEEYICDVGEIYATAPKIDLENIELEKDTEGNYVIPSNAAGTVGRNGEVVTYYYTITPIELQINHYVDGTQKSLADEETITYEGVANIEDNKVESVTINQSYNVEENENYEKLTQEENYENNLITQDDEEVSQNRISFKRNSRLTYYYTVKDGTVKVKYVNKDTDEEIDDEESFTDSVGTTYTIEPKEIEGYTYVERQGDLEGKYTEEEKEVILYYKQEAKVTVNYIDKATNENLDTEETKGVVGDEFTGSAKQIEGYTVVERPENETVTMTATPITLNYYYQATTTVTVKYIDRTTNDEIAEETVINGKVGDRYETEAKEIEGYELVTTPANAEGTMTRTPIEVKYYYLQKVTLTVKYQEYYTKRAVSDTATITDVVGKTYTIPAKTITGYTYMESTDNLSGTLSEDKEIILYYKQNTQATINYVERVTEENEQGEPETREVIIEEKTVAGYVGEEFTGTAKDITGYILVERPINETIILGETGNVLNYYYTKVGKEETSVIEKHIDAATDEILYNEVHEGQAGDAYEILPKTIVGYDLVETRLPTNASGTMTNSVIEVKYYYARKTKITVQYINTLTGEKIDDDVVIEGHEGDQYTTTAKVIEGYDLKERPENASGRMTVTREVGEDGEEIIRTNTVVVYGYKEKSEGVSEKHIDIKSGKVIEEKTYSGYVGDDYETEPKTYKDYDLVENELPENSSGKMTKDLIEVKYYYHKKTDVTVRYVDENTEKDIKDPEVTELHEGDSYKTTPEELDGYELVKEPSNKQGNTPNRDIEVVYYYRRKALVEVKYINKVTGKALADTEIIEGVEGEEYTTEAKQILYYNLIAKPINAKGIMQVKTIEVDGKEKIDNKIEVVYYYVAKDFNLSIEKTISKIVVDGEEQNIPDGKLAKLEIYRRSLDSTEVTIEYKIKVSNIGELEGGATILETIPSGFTMLAEENKGWKIEGQTAEMTVEKLGVGEEKVYIVTLHWNKGEENLGTKTNTVTMIEMKNDAKFNDADDKNNADSSTLILTISTGNNNNAIYMEIILVASILTIATLAGIVYKKKI